MIKPQEAEAELPPSLARINNPVKSAASGRVKSTSRQEGADM